MEQPVLTKELLENNLKRLNANLTHFQNIIVEEKLGSTNDILLELEKTGLEHGSFLITNEQAQGKGRLGRIWTMSAGDIACSFLLRKPHLPKPLTWLSFIPIIAVIKALNNIGIKAWFKWPNDLIVKGPDNVFNNYFAEYLKVGGVLIENVSQLNEIKASVIGLGLNIVKSPLIQEKIPHRGCLLSINPRIERADLVARVLMALDDELNRCCNVDYDLIHQANKYCSSLGRNLSFSHEGQLISGLGEEILPSGALAVKVGETRFVLTSGEVNFCT